MTLIFTEFHVHNPGLLGILGSNECWESEELKDGPIVPEAVSKLDL